MYCVDISDNQEIFYKVVDLKNRGSIEGFYCLVCDESPAYIIFSQGGLSDEDYEEVKRNSRGLIRINRESQFFDFIGEKKSMKVANVVYCRSARVSECYIVLCQGGLSNEEYMAILLAE